MKLIFVENRFATWLWREAAIRLQADGHDIHWIVQNPVFSPKLGTCHLLDFPTRSAKSTTGGNPLDQVPLLKSDRGVRFFGGSGSHYASYIAAIKAVLDLVQPHVIFGEQTQFHELITIAQARRLNIPYLFPTATRYPPGRIAFHVYDTLETSGGCGEDLGRSNAGNLRRRITERQIFPSYMVRAKLSRVATFCRLMKNRYLIAHGWLKGERYATPSPWVKYKLGQAQNAAVARWEKFSHARLPAAVAKQPLVLYAMQMQPESNIDVWGAPWNDQFEIIRAAADALHAIGAKLVVKPNPRSKYELDHRLCDLVESHPGVVTLTHTCLMADVFPLVRAVLSVTGTVILEAVLAGKPIGVLGSHAMTRYPGVTALNDPAEIAGLLSSCLAGAAKSASPEDADELLCILYRQSYPGTFYDPFNQPELATQANLGCIADAFRDIINHIGDAQISSAT